MIYYGDPSMDVGGAVTNTGDAHFTCQELLNYIRANINAQAKFFIIPIGTNDYWGVWVPPSNYPDLTIETLYFYDNINNYRVCAFNFNDINMSSVLGVRYVIRGGTINSSGNASLYREVINDRSYSYYDYSGSNDYIFYTDITGYNVVYNGTPVVESCTSNGGGATHIAKVTGQLKDLSSNLSDILIVSGGGGGGIIVGEDIYTGKDAGGISGSGNNSANQSTGYAFGQGESGNGYSGGGGGLYGGYKGGTS